MSLSRNHFRSGVASRLHLRFCEDLEETIVNDSGFVRKLQFNVQDCQTPSRYLPRQQVQGEPMQVFLRVRPLVIQVPDDEIKVSDGPLSEV